MSHSCYKFISNDNTVQVQKANRMVRYVGALLYVHNRRRCPYQGEIAFFIKRKRFIARFELRESKALLRLLIPTGSVPTTDSVPMPSPIGDPTVGSPSGSESPKGLGSDHGSLKGTQVP